MKKALGLMVLLLLVGSIWAVEDNFTITVSVEWIQIDLKTADDAAAYTNWDVGTVAASTASTMTTGTGGNHVYVNNGSNVVLDFSAYSTSVAPGACGYGTPAAWTPALAAGANQYKLDGGKGTAVAIPGAWTTLDNSVTPGDVYAASELAGADHHFYARLTAPTSVADGCSHTITVYIVAQ